MTRPEATTVRLTPAQMDRLRAAGWEPGLGPLDEWLVRRAVSHHAAPCTCGPDRDEIFKPSDGTFRTRYGCRRCNKWDTPPTLIG